MNRFFLYQEGKFTIIKDTLEPVKRIVFYDSLKAVEYVGMLNTVWNTIKKYKTSDVFSTLRQMTRA